MRDIRSATVTIILYWKPLKFGGRIQMERFISVDIFREKSNNFLGTTVFSYHKYLDY